MDQQAFELLMERLDRIEEQHTEMVNKIDQLLQFKWQIIGGSVVLGSIAQIAFSIIGKG